MSFVPVTVDGTSSTLASTSPSWQNLFAYRQQQENEHIVNHFQWINQYEALYQAHTHILKENHELKQQLTAARDDLQQYRTNPSVNATPSSFPSSSSSANATIANATSAATFAATAEITRLQSKLLELQDQLTGFYRKESETVKERLTLSETNQRLKETITTLQSELTHTKEQYQQLQETYEQSKSALMVREGQLSVTTDELTRLRTMLDSKSKETDILNTQMEGIASRIATEKERSATEINHLNSTVANLRKDRAQLELLLENVHSKLKEKDTEIETLRLTVVQITNQMKMNNTGTNTANNSAGVATDGGLFNRGNPLLSSNVPAPLQELTNRASSLFGQVSAFVTANTGGSSKAVILPATSASSSSVTGSGISLTNTPNPITKQDSLMVDSLSSSVSGLVRDYVFASVPLPSRVHSVIQAHKTDINTVKFTTDNRLIATGSNDGTVALFDVQTSRNCALLLTNTHGNNILCLDTYGPMVTVGCSDRSVRIFDLHTQRVLRSLTGHNGKVQSVLYVPPAGGLSSGTDLSNLSSNNAIATASSTFSRGMLLSGGTDKTVKLWDYKDGRCVRSIDTRSIVNSIAISPDGTNLAVANQDGGVRLFDIRNGAKIAELPNAHSSGVTSIMYSRADGGMTLLTSGRDNTLRLFDGRTLEALGPLVQKDDPSLRSPLNRSSETNHSPLNASSSLYVSGVRLRATSTSSISPSNSFGNTSSSSSLNPVNPVIMKHAQFNLVTNMSRALLSPNGQYAIAGSSDSGIYVWSTAKGEFELELGSNKHQSSSTKLTKKPSAYTNSSGRSRGKSNEDINLFSGAFAELDNENNTNQGYGTAPHHGAGVIGIDWSNDGQYLASGDTQGNLVLWTQ